MIKKRLLFERVITKWTVLLLILSNTQALTQIQFEDVSQRTGIQWIGPSWGAAWGDFNRDGYPDLWLNKHAGLLLFPSLYLYNPQTGTFQDVALQTLPFGITFLDNHGSQWVDFDNDGDLDLLQVSGGEANPIPEHPNFFFVNVDGQLVELAAALGLADPQAGKTPVWVDANRDGRLDVFIGADRRSGSDPRLMVQTENGFENANESAGINLDHCDFGLLTDLSNDNQLDLVCHGVPFPQVVYRLGPFPFVDLRADIGLRTVGTVLDVAAADFNNDLKIDLYMVRGPNGGEVVQVDPNTLRGGLSISGEEKGISFRTAGTVSFSLYPPIGWRRREIFVGSEGRHTRRFFTLSSSDPRNWGIFEHQPGVDKGVYVGYDPDASKWILLGSSPRHNKLTFIITSTEPITDLTPIGFDPLQQPPLDMFLVQTDSGFQNRTRAAGITVPAWGSNLVAADFDNDMDLDLFIVSRGQATNPPDLLYENLGNDTFVLVPNAGGAQGPSLGIGDSVTVADYDNDGFLDLLVTNGKFPPPFDREGPVQLFHNLGNKNHWLEVDLIGTISNRDAIGARVFVTAGGITQLREQNGGMHYRAQNHSRLHFGLGNNATVQHLVIHWPSGIVQELFDVPADQILRVVESQ